MSDVHEMDLCHVVVMREACRGAPSGFAAAAAWVSLCDEWCACVWDIYTPRAALYREDSMECAGDWPGLVPQIALLSRAKGTIKPSHSMKNERQPWTKNNCNEVVAVVMVHCCLNGRGPSWFSCHGQCLKTTTRQAYLGNRGQCKVVEEPAEHLIAPDTATIM